jgi:AcrR family transcriptional regulator
VGRPVADGAARCRHGTFVGPRQRHFVVKLRHLRRAGTEVGTWVEEWKLGMYLTNQDPRFRLCSDLICDTLELMLADTPLRAVTVRDLCTRAGVGRSTFYRHFECPLDVLVWKCDETFTQLCAGYLEKCARRGSCYQNADFLRYFFAYFEEHPRIVDVLLAQDRFDLLYESGMNIVGARFKEAFTEARLQGEDYEYFIAIRAGLALGLLRAWFHNGRDKSIDELMRLLKTSHRSGSSTLPAMQPVPAGASPLVTS